MPNENLNDFHWKNKLEDVGSLAAETLADKNATWEKLHSRLRQGPRRTRPVWYWAAAGILMIIAITVILPAKKQDGFVNNNIVKAQPAKAINPEILPSKENTITVASSLIKKKKIPDQAQKSNPKKVHINGIVKKEETVSANPVEQEYLQRPPEILPVIADNHPAIAAAPVKKKLKVVHINELGDPDEEISSTTQYNKHRSFQLKLINQEVYTSVSFPSNNTGFNIFKTKIPPSN